MTDASQVMAIRRRLKYAWSPFFNRFGRLTPAQVGAIPRVLDGINVVVATPTASGKTESVVAPVAELCVQEDWAQLSMLYIVPTRALANDTLARISGPLSDMGLTTILKHGDNPSFPSRKLPNCLITTPESLDSMICRRPKVLVSLKAIILDEIHLLDNTSRGDQLRVLLNRLKADVCAHPFAVHLLSATLAAPEEIAGRYTQDFAVVTIEGQRDVNAYICRSHAELTQLAKSQRWRKLIVFCNLRESVEETAAELTPLWKPYPVVAHHGSLSKRVREEAETIMQESNVAVCVATSTLEIGIDIGNVDLVVLAEVPWNVSALLQRVGRGNRRKGSIDVAAVVSSDDEERAINAMLWAAKSGQLREDAYEPDLSVAVQQIFSCLYRHRSGLLSDQLIERLIPICSPEDARAILDHLANENWIERRLGYWFATPQLLDMGDEGQIHSNIPDSQTYTVVDGSTGRQIGKVMGAPDHVFVLGQRAWRVTGQVGELLYVRPFAGQAMAPTFQKSRGQGAFHEFLPEGMR